MQTKGKFTLYETMDEFAQFLAKPLQRQIVRILDHHTLIPGYKQFTGTNHFGLLTGMDVAHKQRGFGGIAQNLTIFPDGTVAVCRSFEERPACTKGANTGSLCIENLGNFDKGKDEMTPAQRDAIVRVNALLCHRFKLSVDADHIVYHHWYDLNTGVRTNGTGVTKTCPGSNFFGGNKVADAKANFLPLVAAALAEIAAPLPTPLPIPLPTPVPAPAARVAATGGLTVRNEPRITATNKLGTLPNGAIVHIHEEQGIWRRIDPAAQRWVSGTFLVPAAPAEVPAPAPAPVARVKVTGGLTVRSEPRITATNKLGLLPDGAIVHIHEVQGIWRRIDPVAQRWVSGKFLVPG
ncbi:MAG TPA: N-acetylmuramoyl-L-alanine amidase [Longimicrobiaceae bacterium]|nr:N-acetylmuramoyl-L-alanine amidase [Longimicrobiaceae bacterium]